LPSNEKALLGLPGLIEPLDVSGAIERFGHSTV
jgi:hypothetical protein